MSYSIVKVYMFIVFISTQLKYKQIICNHIVLFSEFTFHYFYKIEFINKFDVNYHIGFIMFKDN